MLVVLPSLPTTHTRVYVRTYVRVPSGLLWLLHRCMVDGFFWTDEYAQALEAAAAAAAGQGSAQRQLARPPLSPPLQHDMFTNFCLRCRFAIGIRRCEALRACMFGWVLKGY